MSKNDPTRRYAWDGDDVQFPSDNTEKSPVRDTNGDDTEKETTESKKETKEAKKEKPEKKDKKEEKAEKPEKEKKKKSAHGQPAPADLVDAIEDVISGCIAPPLISRFISEFPGGCVAKSRKSAEKYVLDRNSKVHEEFKVFCISNLSGDDIESLDALTELLDDYKNDYDAFMNRFHEIWETYFKLGRKVFLEDDAYVPLKQCHDKYFGNESKTETSEKEKKAKPEMLEKDKKEAKTEMLEKKETKKEKPEKKDKKETKPEKSEKEREKSKKEKPEKEKKKRSGHEQPPPGDLIRAIKVVISGSLLTSLEPLFLACFPDAGKRMGDGRTPRDFLLNRECGLHQEFIQYCISQLCYDIKGLDALTELLDDYADDYVSFMNRFHDIWEKYFKLRRKVHLDDEFYVPLEQCHDKYWDENNKKPK